MKINYFAVPGFSVEKYTPEMLKLDISTFYNIPVEMLSSKSRKAEYVEARSIAFYFLNIHFGLSLAEAGMFLGARDHATGTHNIQILDAQYKINRQLKGRFDSIKDIVKPKIRRLKPYNGRGEVLLKNLEYSQNYIK